MSAPIRILHLEDDPYDTRLVHHALADLGLETEIRSVDNRADYVALLEAGGADVILADYRVPTFGDMEALDLARSRCPAVPFIYVTGALGDELAVETLRRGATDCVLKDRLVRLPSSVRRALAEAEEQAGRRKAESALRVTEERLRIALANSGISAHACDRDLRYIWVHNPIQGFTRAQMEGRTDAEILPPQNVQELIDLKRSVIATEQRMHRQISVAIGGIRRDYDVTAEPLRDACGVVRGVTVAMMDISEVLRAKSALEEANRAKDYFLAVLSHELRTPLMPIMAGIAILQADPQLESRALEILEMIRRNVELEARLIDDLLDLTRITRGRVDLTRRPADLRVIVERAVEVCRSDIRDANLTLQLDLSDSPCLVEVDEARMQQVFWNLLKNAIKFTPGGGWVRIRCAPHLSRAVFEIVDSGAGIEPSMLDRIFNAFEQSSAPRTSGGLGLGLAICRSLVDLHGGSIEAFSRGRGFGARFVVSLPLMEISPPGVGGCTDRVQAGGRSPALRILVVEDHPDTIAALTRLLAMEGHEVRAASSVAMALDLVCSEPFDLVLSDLGLPDGSGLDLMRRIRARGIQLSAIALSGYGQERDVQESLLAGFFAHLTKPVDMKRLLKAIGSLNDAIPASESMPGVPTPPL